MLETKLKRALESSTGRVKIPKIPPHCMLKKDIWTCTGFREDDISLRKRHIIDDMEKYQKELYNDLVNFRKTTPRPDYMDVNDNILTLIGLTNTANNDAGVSNQPNTHMSLGDQVSPTTPAEGDTDLEQEISGGTPTYARLAFATDGQATVVNQTAKYGMLWDDGDIDVTPSVNITEVGLHWHVSDASKMHARIAPTTFTFDTGDLYVVQMNEAFANA